MSYPVPRYLGDKGEISATLRLADQTSDLTIGSHTDMHYLSTGTSTHGQFGLYKVELKPRAAGPGAHFHRTMSEAFFILSGKMRVFDGRRWLDMVKGDYLYVPEGGIHAFHSESDEPSSMLLLFVPGGPREEYFEALAQIAAGRQFSEADWREFCARHDNYFL